MSDALEEVVNQIDTIKEKLTDGQYKVMMDTLAHCRKYHNQTKDQYDRLQKDYILVTKQFIYLFIEREGSYHCDHI